MKLTSRGGTGRVGGGSGDVWGGVQKIPLIYEGDLNSSAPLNQQPSFPTTYNWTKQFVYTITGRSKVCAHCLFSFALE